MTVRCDPAGDSLVVLIDRAPLNALDLKTIETLHKTFATLAAQPPKAGVVLTGAGDRAFSAGVDTKAVAGYGPEQRRALVLEITRMTAALLSLPCPIVAAVNGHALGGGFVLMLACDLRLAVQSAAARFGLTEAQAGIPFPAGPAEIIRSELPPNLLRRWTLSSAVVDAAMLLEEGIVDALHSTSDLVSQAVMAARTLAAQPAFATVKRQVRGPLAERVAALAKGGNDPFMASFS